MKQLTKFRYRVAQGEEITIRAVPIGTGPRITVTNNGKTVKNSNDSQQPTFEVEANEVPGNSHFVIIECGFLKSDPSDARFDLEIRGSRGGVFKDIAVRKANIIWDPEFRFTVD